MQALVVKLLLIAQSLTGYATPELPPSVVFLAHHELERRACDRPCPVLGWFPPGRTIYLDDRLDPLGDLRARAVLLHELVHFLQQENDAFAGPTTCRSWLEREREAIAVERSWLIDQPGGRVAGDWQRRVPLEALCRAPPGQTPDAIGPAREAAGSGP